MRFITKKTSITKVTLRAFAILQLLYQLNPTSKTVFTV